MANENGPKRLDGAAYIATERPFNAIKPQAPPNDPKIKKLLSRALMAPETLTPTEVREMAASLVYHLLSLAKS